jgi:multidrug resistance efflux pump
MIDQDSALLKALTVAALVGVGTAILTGCAAKADAQAAAPVSIAVERAAPAEPVATYRGPGVASATHTYRVGFEAAGRVTAVNADVGDFVRAGSVLATIDDADARAQYEGARARAASAAAGLQKTLNGARSQERAEALAAVDAARANLGRAQAALELAAANDRRYQALLRDGDVSRQQADSARTALLDTQGQVLAARAQLAQTQQSASAVIEGARDEDRRLAQADAAAAEAGADQAAATLRKTVVRAPADVFVQSRAVEPGDQTTAGSIAFVLVDAAPSDVIVDVPEARAIAIDARTPATVIENGRRYRARVVRVEPSADSATRTLRTRLHPEGLSLRPGAVVDVAIGERPPEGAGVPLGAVLHGQGGAHVLVYDAAHDTVAVRPVTVIDSTSDRATVRGVRAGEAIVTAGQFAAHPGDAVRVVRAS